MGNAYTVYSPGPWHAEVRSNRRVIASQYETICTDVKDSNAADLIAAAPDLLEALRVLTAALQSCRIGMTDKIARKLAGEMVEQGRAAIAKATGE